MTCDELIANVTEWVAAKSHELTGKTPEVEPGDDLLATGILDSLGFVALVAHIEDTTDCELDLLDLDPDDFSCIRGLCQAALETRG